MFGHFISSPGEAFSGGALLKRALAIWEKAMGSDHFEAGIAVGSLARLRGSQRSLSEAELLLKRSLTIFERLGTDHPNVALTLTDLGDLYMAQGRYSEAEPLIKRSLALREKALEPDRFLVECLWSLWAGCTTINKNMLKQSLC